MLTSATTRTRRLLSGARRQDGFTLVEVMVAAGISMGVLVIILGLLNVAMRTQVFTQKQTDAFYAARGGVNQVQKDVTAAQGVTLPQLTDPAFGTWMELAVVTPSAGGIDRVRYELAGTELVRRWHYDQVSGTYAQEAVVASQVANLAQSPGVPAFSCLPGSQLGTIAVQLLVKPTEREETYRLNTQLRPRNSFTYCG